MTLFDRRRVRHLQHFDLIAEQIRRLGRNVPRSGRLAVAGSVDFTSAVRRERPRRFALLRERLDLVMKGRRARYLVDGHGTCC